MTHRGFILALVFFVQPMVAFSNTKPRVIDLGEDSSESSIRRPSLKIVESDSSVLKFLPGVYRSQFELLEKELVKPKQDDFTKLKNEGSLR